VLDGAQGSRGRGPSGAKAEAGRMTVEHLDFDPRALTNDTVRFWRAGAKAKGLSLKMTGGKDLPPWLRGDPVRIRQVLNNLLSNAIKFTAEGQVELAVEARREGEGEGWVLSVAVTDTGPGLSPDQLARLFTAYDQLGADTARTFGGTGLGLSISRDLARLMGGDLAAQSAPGGGARFILTLPVPEGVAPAALATSSPTPVAFADKPLALVVDDHEVNRRLLDQILRALGVRTVLATDGEAALAAAGARRFDVVLMDINMPGLDGLDTTRRLRAGGPNARTPVIAVTAGVSPSERSACVAAGMDDWVEKPFQIAALQSALARALGSVSD
jgi:CheY-like chemotaxis protein